jgi:hypothetical protein
MSYAVGIFNKGVSMSGGGGGKPESYFATIDDIRRLKKSFINDFKELIGGSGMHIENSRISDEDSIEAKGFMAKNRQEIFHHHTYDLIKKKDDEIKKLTSEVATLKESIFWGDKAHHDEVAELKGKIFDLDLQRLGTNPFSFNDEITGELKRAPWYQGDGNLSVQQLQTLCKEYKEYCYQINIKHQDLEKKIESHENQMAGLEDERCDSIGKIEKLEESQLLKDLKFYSFNGHNFTKAEVVKHIEKLERELDQQRFNNKHNLSIDQKVADQMKHLEEESAKAHGMAAKNFENGVKVLAELEEVKKTNKGLNYDLRIGKIHKKEELIKIIDDQPYLLDREGKNYVWTQTIIAPDRFKRFRPVTVEEALTRGFNVF